MNGTRFIRTLIGFLLAPGLAAQVVHHWRFENSPGFLSDSVGGATLSNSGTTQGTLPGSGRGSGFLALPSSHAADFDEGDRLSGTITALTGNFTVEAFIHRDTNSGVYFDLIAGSTDTSFFGGTDGAWQFSIRLDGYNGTSANELILDVGDGTAVQTMQSDFIIPTGKDYYVAATFNLAGGQAKFYVQNLTDSGSLLTSTASHTLTSLANRTGVFIAGHGSHPTGDVHFDGLIDEVRLSNAVLPQGDLLISAIPEPGTYALIAGALGLAVAALQRRRARNRC